jgi:hypothetical protein
MNQQDGMTRQLPSKLVDNGNVPHAIDYKRPVLNPFGA